MDNPGSILVLSGVLGDTRRYRALHLVQQLQMAGAACTYAHITDPGIETAADLASVLVLQRVAYTPLAAGLIQRVRQNGGMVLADTDDLVFDPQAFRWINSPDFQMRMRRELYQQDMRLQRDTLEACDGVIVSTDYLAGLVRAMGRPVWVHRNAANTELEAYSRNALAERRTPDGRVIIGYASGTPTHDADFALAAPALRQLLREHPQVHLQVMGYLNLDASWREFDSRVRAIPPVAWRELPPLLADLDINLAPLAQDNPFSQSKSEIKWMEAAFVGVPTLASATDAFRYAIRDGQNGILIHTDADWLPTLERMLDAKLRANMGASALADVQANYRAVGRARDAVQLLNDAAAQLGRDMHWDFQPPQDFGYERFLWPGGHESGPSLWQMGLYNWRYRGAGVLFKRVIIQARRFLARWIPFKAAKNDR